MRIALVLATGLCLAVFPSPAPAAEPPAAQPGDTISWVKPLTEGYAQALKEKKPLLICINSERVDGGRVEAAAKELREVTDKDAAVVTRSREFVNVFLTAEGSSEDFGELRARYAIEGLIVSPQHIFAFPDGKLISRQEYWSHGTGERAVKAMLDLLDQALAKHKADASLPPTPGPAAPPPSPDAGPAPAAPPAPDADPTAWRRELIEAVVKGPSETRKEALRRLLLEDKDGANLKAIVEVFVKLEENKDLGAQIDVVRAVGRPGLKGATACLVERLDAKDEALRGNVAVSLEYIGDPEAVDGLKGRLDREKSEAALATRSVIDRARGPHGSPPSRRSVASMVGRVRARSSRWRACTAAAILTLERCIAAPRGRLAVASERRGPSGSAHA